MAGLLACGLVLLWGACSTPAASVAPVHVVAPAGDLAPAPVEPAEPGEAPPTAQVAPAQAGSPEIWRFTTLVTGGPETLVGANGYYEIVLDGDKATVRKVGVRGTPQLPAERVAEGSGTLTLAADPAWPAARSGTLTITLVEPKAKQQMALSFWVLGDQMHGTWFHPDARGEKFARAWGLLEGMRERGEPLALVDGERAPCQACTYAFFNCEGSGPGSCNQSNVAIDECNSRLRTAKKKSAEVPRGCGDWMHKG